MNTTYLCPHCRGAINASNHIILSAKAKDNTVGLVLLNEEIGNYSSIVSSSLIVKDEEVVDFYCPICHKSLNIPKKEDLAKYIRLDENLQESFIIISRKYGEQITFRVDENKNVKTYGEKLNRFIDPEWFL